MPKQSWKLPGSVSSRFGTCHLHFQFVVCSLALRHTAHICKSKIKLRNMQREDARLWLSVRTQLERRKELSLLSEDGECQSVHFVRVYSIQDTFPVGRNTKPCTGGRFFQVFPSLLPNPVIESPPTQACTSFLEFWYQPGFHKFKFLSRGSFRSQLGMRNRWVSERQRLVSGCCPNARSSPLVNRLKSEAMDAKHFDVRIIHNNQTKNSSRQERYNERDAGNAAYLELQCLHFVSVKCIQDGGARFRNETAGWLCQKSLDHQKMLCFSLN